MSTVTSFLIFSWPSKVEVYKNSEHTVKGVLEERYIIKCLRQDCFFAGHFLLVFPAKSAWTLTSLAIAQYPLPQFLWWFFFLLCTSVINILYSISDCWSEYSSYFFCQFYILDVRFVSNRMPCKHRQDKQNCTLEAFQSKNTHCLQN